VLALAGVALVGVGLAAVMPQEARARVLTLSGATTDQSGAFRLRIWRDTLRLAASSPFVGSGFGAYADAIPRFKTAAGDLRVEHPENEYLEVLAEGGVVGGVLAAALVLMVLRRGARAIREEPHRLPRGLRAGALAGAVALLAHGGFDFNLHIPSNALLFVTLAAMLLGASVTESGEAGRAGPRPAALGALVLLALTTSTLLAVSAGWTDRGIAPGALARASVAPADGLRRTALQADVASHIRRRPADAPAWLALAWLRAPSSRAEAVALARRSIQLDPTQAALRREAERFRAE
jgi:hypothetical protein